MRYPPTSITTVAVSNASAPIVSGNPRRKAIIFFITSGITLAINYRPLTGTTDGLPLSNQTYPYIFDVDRFGDFATHQIHGFASQAGTIGILEVFDDESLPDHLDRIPLSIPRPPDYGTR